MSQTLGVIDWTQIMLEALAILPATIAAIGTYILHRQMRTPSGDTIGRVAERTHDLAAVDVALTTQIHGVVAAGETRRTDDLAARAHDDTEPGG